MRGNGAVLMVVAAIMLSGITGYVVETQTANFLSPARSKAAFVGMSFEDAIAVGTDKQA